MGTPNVCYMQARSRYLKFDNATTRRRKLQLPEFCVYCI